MRQKFRIYDSKKGKMIYSGSTPTMLSAFFNATAVLHTWHEMEYEEYIDRKDKNGKEIYEGDVVIVRHCEIDSCQGVIEWDDKQASFVFKGEVIANMFLWCFEEIEIIGNITQNPELLND